MAFESSIPSATIEELLTTVKDVEDNKGGLAGKNEVLTKTNTASFTPTGDYNPATKKYVDDYPLYNVDNLFTLGHVIDPDSSAPASEAIINESIFNRISTGGANETLIFGIQNAINQGRKICSTLNGNLIISTIQSVYNSDYRRGVAGNHTSAYMEFAFANYIIKMSVGVLANPTSPAVLSISYELRNN